MRELSLLTHTTLITVINGRSLLRGSQTDRLQTAALCFPLQTRSAHNEHAGARESRVNGRMVGTTSFAHLGRVPRLSTQDSAQVGHGDLDRVRFEHHHGRVQVVRQCRRRRASGRRRRRRPWTQHPPASPTNSEMMGELTGG